MKLIDKIKNYDTYKSKDKIKEELIKYLEKEDDYKKRNEKAIEYIKRFDLILGYYDYNDEGYDEIGENNNLQEELINILNGRSDE